MASGIIPALLLFALVAISSGYQDVQNFEMPITGNSRPPQECPITSDLKFQRCLSPCRSYTCAEVHREMRTGTRPCVRMCVSGWACPAGQYLLDGYSDVCVKKKACKRSKRTRTCTYENEALQVNTSFLKGSLTCRCFADGVVRCRNPFPQA